MGINLLQFVGNVKYNIAQYGGSKGAFGASPTARDRMFAGAASGACTNPVRCAPAASAKMSVSSVTPSFDCVKSDERRSDQREVPTARFDQLVCPMHKQSFFTANYFSTMSFF